MRSKGIGFEAAKQNRNQVRIVRQLLLPWLGGATRRAEVVVEHVARDAVVADEKDVAHEIQIQTPSLF